MGVKWPEVRLGEVLRQNTAVIECPETREYKKLSVRLYGNGVVMDAPVDGAILKMKRHQLARAGQVIVSEIWGKKGAIGIVPPSGDGALCTCHFFLFDPLTDRIDVGYLALVLRGNLLQEQLGAEAKGSTGYAAVRPHHFLRCIIPLPSLSEQRRIVDRIEAIAADVNEARRLRGAMVEDAEGLVLSLHTQLAGSRTRKIGDLVRLEEDVAPVTATESYPQVGVRSFGGGLFAKGAVTGGETTYRGFNRLYRDALVLSQVKGWEGAIAVCPEDLEGWFVSPEYRTFRCNPTEVRPDYLRALVQTEWFWGRLGDATRGVGARRERTRPERFLSVSIPMPCVEDQAVGARVFAELASLRGVCVNCVEDLDAIMPAVLDRAFKGEL